MVKKPNSTQITDVNKFIRHLRMFTNHSQNKITYTMDGIVDKCPQDLHFTNREGKVVTIAEYFQIEYNIELMKLPLVKTIGKQARYIPMELCTLVQNQFLSNSKINSNIQRELLLKSTNTPNVYFHKLDSVVKKVAAIETDLQRSFGIELDTKPVSFTGRVLPTPRQLNADSRGKFFSTKDAPARWAVFCFDMAISQDNLDGFVKQMTDRARYFGLNFAPPHPVAKVDVKDASTIYNAFYNLVKMTQTEFIFVGIPSRKLHSPLHLSLTHF